MIVSLNWLKKFTKIDLPIDELATLIGSRLVEIEEVIDLGAKYKDALIVSVIECERIEGSDHLSLLKVDDGGISQVERDDKGLVQVVCGAPNVSVGQKVVWLQPGCVVPSTVGTSEPFELGARKLQGHVSNGMIASAKELDLFDDHTGILVLDETAQVGKLFAEAYELNDYLLDIENKSLTHRPDCFSIIGFAREVAAITGRSFKTPDFMLNLQPDFGNANEVELKVAIDNPELSKRYMAIVVAGADGHKHSPLLIQTYLARVGVRPINAVVDVTNYLMMLAGQPLHAFDYDKLVAVGGSADIHVRAGRDGEKLELLDGKTITLTDGDIVIAAGETAIGLAGAMGGANTEIDDNTKNIIIESATFNLYNLRSTQMRHGISSEAITRFTKGQSPDQTAPVLADAVRLMAEWAGAHNVSLVADTYPGKSMPTKIELTSHQINDILGSDFTYQEVTGLLSRAEFQVEELGNSLNVTAPYWRQDIHITEDCAEEVGRISGFDNIAPVLPKRDFKAVRPSAFDQFKTKVRKTLTKSGANEVLTYTFVHGDILSKAGQDIANSYQVTNSISPTLQYYRQSLSPSLLDLVHPNIKQGFDEFALFELNKAFSKSDGMNDEGVPVEKSNLALVIAKKAKGGSPYYAAKKILSYLTQEVGVIADFEVFEPGADVVSQLFEPKRSAVVKAGGGVIGYVGEYKRTVSRNFKLPEYSAGFEIDMDKLMTHAKDLATEYHPISRFPSAERDVCFRIRRSISYRDLLAAVNGGFEKSGVDHEVSPLDIYHKDDDETKNITFRLKITASDRTLSGDEVSGIVDAVVASVKAKTSGELV